MKKEVKIVFHSHALQRMSERGATEEEVRATISNGENFKAKLGRVGFRRNFYYKDKKNSYNSKQIEAYGVFESNLFVVITVICKYF